MNASHPDENAATLRDALVRELIETGRITTPAVERAFRTVPRHRFVMAGTPLEITYSVDKPIIIKRDTDGAALSSTSATYIQAVMLELANLGPGIRVLEIGSGGYNAALIAEIVGPEGQVVSIDIDEDVTDRARVLLAATGYGPRVTVVHADADTLAPALDQTFDAILVTVGAWDIAPAWLRCLSTSGRLVVPLRLNGVTRVVGFRRQGDHLVSTATDVAGFVAMQGAGVHDERVALLPDGHGRNIRLSFAEAVPELRRLDGVLATDRVEAWSGVTIENNVSFADLYLWFAAFLPGFCKLAADDGLALTTEPNRWFPFGMVHQRTGDSFAYLIIRPLRGIDGAEFGAAAVGPHADQAARAMTEQILAWSRSSSDHPVICYWPTSVNTPVFDTSTAVLIKTHGIATISWQQRGFDRSPNVRA